MKKYGIFMVTVVFLTGIMLPVLSTSVQAADNSNSCVLMKFVNKTRFKKLAPEAKISDLVMEKLVASGKLHLKETRPIDETIEQELYDDKYRFEKKVAKVEEGNYDALFDNKEADSMSNAYQGQEISPELTSSIGKKHGAEYLIQGTIYGVSRGKAEDAKTSFWTSMTGMIAGKAGGDIGKMVSSVLRDTKKIYSGVDIQSDLRVIRASTGEVVWQKGVTAECRQEKVELGNIASVGTDKISMNLYEMALDQAAQKIVDELLVDVDKGLLLTGN